MYIKWIKIANFRGIKGGFFPFKPGMNILIGPSNVGKSTILAAIDLVLNPYYAWWRRDVLSELDFYNRDTSKPIYITLMLGCGPHRCIEPEEQCPRFEIGNEETCKLADRAIYIGRETSVIFNSVQNFVSGLLRSCSAPRQSRMCVE
jgi:predicted ATPase